MTPEALKQSTSDLQQHIWRTIGPRKWLVGREGVCKITMIAVQRWPAKYADSPDAQQGLREYIVTQMRDYRGYDRRYGSIWAIILSAVVAQIVQALVKWWLERRENQDLMAYMRTFRGKDGQECL